MKSNNRLSSFATCELVEELKNREGVEHIVVDVEQSFSISIDGEPVDVYDTGISITPEPMLIDGGPATLLIVID